MRTKRHTATPSGVAFRSPRVGVVLLVTLIAGLVSGCCTICCKPGGGTKPCTTTAAESALVLHTPSALEADFSLLDTLKQIIATSPAPSTTPVQLLQTILDSLAATSLVQPPLGVSLTVTQAATPGSLVAKDLILDPADPTSGSMAMKPLALFNRFDLAPQDGSNCGEYRIVYSIVGGPRFLLIFESRLPNPDPSAGIAGCKTVVDLWQSLASLTDDAARAAALKPFYYGTSSGGPVVDFANYGVPLGQVRANLLISSPWILREFRAAQDPLSLATIFKADTDKETPIPELFRSTGLPAVITPAQRTGYRNHFLNQPVCNLTAPDRTIAAPSAQDIVNGIGPGFNPAGDDLESISQGNVDDPAQGVDPTYDTALQARLTQLALDTKMTTTHLMNRAGAMTCGGCHEFSNGAQLDNDPTHVWPSSAGFVHVNDNGMLSDALNLFFLVQRKKQLEAFLCDPKAQTQPVSCPGSTVTVAQMIGPQGTRAPEMDLTGLVSSEEAAALQRNRTAAYFQTVDRARLTLLAAQRQLQRLPRSEQKAMREQAVRAAEALEQAVVESRIQEWRLQGAFMTVRRTH